MCALLRLQRYNETTTVTTCISTNAYGNHVGWTEGGVFYDSNNDVIGFTRDHTQHLPSHPGYGGTPGIPALEWRPGKPGFEGEPGRPGYGGWSSMDFEDYIKECK